MEPLDLPQDVSQVLSLGPKFAVEPKPSAPQLLSMVRQVSQRATQLEHDRCISGVDVLHRSRPGCSKLPLKRVENFIKERGLAVLRADKEGGFAVLSFQLYSSKADQAVASVFECREGIVLSKVKSKAKKLCNKLNLSKLAKEIGDSRKDFLDVFFSAKTHKPEQPFRVIVSETGTWQKAISKYLQGKLNLLNIDDPFGLRNSEELLDFVRTQSGERICGFSVDIKDLYYSLPIDKVLCCVEECIDEFGCVAFQNAAGVSASSFFRAFIHLLAVNVD